MPPVIQHPASTLTQYLIEQRRRHPGATGEFNALVLDIAQACKAISRTAAHGSLGGILGALEPLAVAGADDGCADDALSELDSLANDIFVRTTERGATLSGLASDCMREPRLIPSEYPRGKYLLAFDPLDGAIDTDVNVSVGSIFSILRAPQPVASGIAGLTREGFLQSGAQQVAAGYAIYGPSTMLVLTVGQGVVGFTLDPLLGDFLLTHPDIRIPDDTDEFAIDASNNRFWEAPVKRYVEECLAGRIGPRGKEFQMRWVATLVAEAHRILMRGGVFLAPQVASKADDRGASSARPLLLFEANPIAMIVEQAGGRASTGEGPLLAVEPAGLHQRVGMVFGSSGEVERIEGYHTAHRDIGLENTYGTYYSAGEPTGTESSSEETYEDLPLFHTRGLFRDDD
jgi:fructose-1,6-bisphosphatase I/sedoheptulose-1,7-bisphosphatase